MDIAALRKESRMTQDELAKELGCSNSAVGYWEKGHKPSRRWERKLEKLFSKPTLRLKKVTGDTFRIGKKPVGLTTPKGYKGRWDDLMNDVKKCKNADDTVITSLRELGYESDKFTLCRTSIQQYAKRRGLDIRVCAKEGLIYVFKR